jgi:hypothetical protein
MGSTSMVRVSTARRAFSPTSDRWIAPSQTEAGTCDTVWGIIVLKHLDRPDVAVWGSDRVLRLGVRARVSVPAQRSLHSALDEAS